MGCPNKDDPKAPSFAVKLQWPTSPCHSVLVPFTTPCAQSETELAPAAQHTPSRVGSLSGRLLLMLEHSNAQYSIAEANLQRVACRVSFPLLTFMDGQGFWLYLN